MKMLKCSSCGGELTETDEMFICDFCGTKFVKEKSDIEDRVRVASIDRDSRIEEMLKRADVYWRHGKEQQAKMLYRQILELDASCSIAWERGR